MCSLFATLDTFFTEFFAVLRVLRGERFGLLLHHRVFVSHRGTGKALSKFTFFKELDDLFGSRHDIEFAVTSTADIVTVPRADLLAAKTDDAVRMCWAMFDEGDRKRVILTSTRWQRIVT